MEFSQNKAIYLQIVDAIYEKIISGTLKAGDRILSVRELGANLGVNPNTVMRSYEKMTADGAIFNKRGIGYFVTDDAPSNVLAAQRKAFLEEEWPLVKKKIALLGLKLEEL